MYDFKLMQSTLKHIFILLEYQQAQVVKMMTFIH